jgi:hypothetical protein
VVLRCDDHSSTLRKRPIHRLLALLGYLPIGLDHLARTAAGPARQRAWLAWGAVGVTAAGVAGAAGLVTWWLASQLVGRGAWEPPLVAAVIVASAAGLAILVVGRRLTRWLLASFRILPAVVALCVVLAVVPVVQVVLELIVHPETASDLVNRRGGQGLTLVSVEGVVLLVPYPAEPPPDAGAATASAYRWYLLRDSPGDQRIALLRSPMPVEALRTRTIVVRVVDDPGAVASALTTIAARDGAAPRETVTPRLLAEVAGPVDGVRDLGSLAAAATASVGELLRVRVRIDEGVASCVPRGDCDARRLAAGLGTWDNLASDTSGTALAVVRTTYPPSVAPFRGVGELTRDRELIARFLSEPGARGVLGWGRSLRTATIDHDPSLPVDHLWLGPILFAALSALLLAGRLVGYPVFRGTAPGSVPRGLWSAEIRGRATGRITPPNESPHDFDDRPATLRAHRREGTEVSVELASRRLEVTIPRLFGGLGSTEVGELVFVNRAVPALKVDWYGTNLLLTFADRGARDAAVALIERD